MKFSDFKYSHKISIQSRDFHYELILSNILSNLIHGLNFQNDLFVKNFILNEKLDKQSKNSS